MKKHWYTSKLPQAKMREAYRFAIGHEAEAYRAIDQLPSTPDGERFFLKVALPNVSFDLVHGQYIRCAPIRAWQIRRRQRRLTELCDEVVKSCWRQARRSAAA